jgi:hypothetical protein
MTQCFWSSFVNRNVYKVLSVSKVTNKQSGSKTLFWIPLVHDTYVADATCQTFNIVTIYMLPFFPPWHQGLHASVEDNLSSVCSQELAACFVSVSNANHLPVRCFIRSPEKWRSLSETSEWQWQCCCKCLVSTCDSLQDLNMKNF